MASRTPITVRNLYRSILGRVSGYRANRIIVVSGTIVGVPEAPLNELGFRNLLYKARDVASDGKPALMVYVSSGDTTSAFTPKESTLSPQRYLNSTFVNVRQDDNTIVTCLHVVVVDGTIVSYCPEIEDGIYDLDRPNDVLMTVIPNDATSIVSVTNGEYELVEGVHYSYDLDYYTPNRGVLNIFGVYLSGEFEQGDTVELMVQFDICDPIPVMITSESDVS